MSQSWAFAFHEREKEFVVKKSTLYIHIYQNNNSVTQNLRYLGIFKTESYTRCYTDLFQEHQIFLKAYKLSE